MLLKFPLVLASASTRRYSLLKQIGCIPSEIIDTNIDESVYKREIPAVYCSRMAMEKAKCVNRPGSIVLGVDTIACAGRRILGKPSTEKEAENMLSLLSGRRHRVNTSMCFIMPDLSIREKQQQTIVKIKSLSNTEIKDYVATGEWAGKAGGYAIQGKAAIFVEWISGTADCVIGLPLCSFRKVLDDCIISF